MKPFTYTESEVMAMRAAANLAKRAAEHIANDASQFIESKANPGRAPALIRADLDDMVYVAERLGDDLAAMVEIIKGASRRYTEEVLP